MVRKDIHNKRGTISVCGKPSISGVFVVDTDLEKGEDQYDGVYFLHNDTEFDGGSPDWEHAAEDYFESSWCIGMLREFDSAIEYTIEDDWFSPDEEVYNKLENFDDDAFVNEMLGL